MLALALTVVTGTLSASLALLGDAVDSASLYLNRTDGGWPATTGITEPLQIEPLADGFVELGNEDVLVYSAYGSKILSLQPSYARPVLAVGGTHFVVYNRAGSELTVCSRTRMLYTQRFDEDILLCAMSNNNSLAVVTDADRFAGWVHIYDPSMRELYSWRMPQSMGTPIALDFAPDNRRFASGMIAARDGQLNCSVYFMSLDSDAEGCSTPPTRAACCCGWTGRARTASWPCLTPTLRSSTPAPPPRSHATTTAGPRCKALHPDAARPRCF